jgi:hypothetical protein
MYDERAQVLNSPARKRETSHHRPLPEINTMRKSFIVAGGQDEPTPKDAWLDLEHLPRVEVTS